MREEPMTSPKRCRHRAMTTRWIDRRLHIRERKCERCGDVWHEMRFDEAVMTEQMGLLAGAVNARKS